MSNDEILDELEEGSLYVFKKGVLQEIETDPEDHMKKLKITPGAFKVATLVQGKIRKHMGGYRPDVGTICSALIDYAGQSEAAVAVVQRYVIRLYQSLDEEMGDV